MRKFFLITLLCLSFWGNAQGENDNWYFGQFAGLNFSNPTPTFLNNSQLSMMESCGTASDSNGSLLFYCGPTVINNREHQVMENGTGILSTETSQQLAIVKNPANKNQYFLFTTGEGATGPANNNRIRYSIIDMSLGQNGGNGAPLGAVVQNAKNIDVVDNNGNSFFSEAVTVLKGATPNTYWVLIPNGNSLFSYKVDNTGFVNGNPVVSNMNFPVTLDLGKYYSIKASPAVNNPNFTNYVCVSYWYYTNMSTGASTNTSINRVLAFNGATGTLNNTFSLTVNGIQTYMPEFNQNASVLFLGFKHLYAVDLLNSTSSNVISSQIYAETSSTQIYGTGIQRNKYGDIYISRYDSNFLGRVNNPNVYGAGMSVTMNAVQLGTRLASYGLPQLIPYFVKETYYPCINNITLDTPETNTDFVYNVGNDIITEAHYSISNDKRIVMNAGNSITLLPDTDIQAKEYTAKIVPCNRGSTSREAFARNLDQTNMVLNLDVKERKVLDAKIAIYPNPVSDVLNIKTDSKINAVSVIDLTGKKINVIFNNNKVDVRKFPAGAYLIRIETKGRIFTEKFIKK